MMQVLKVLGRVILISFGLMCIAAGGLCTVMGSASGGEGGWVAIIGIVSLLVGVAVVWQTFRIWLGKPTVASSTTDASERENP
jgi:hypothetical protein